MARTRASITYHFITVVVIFCVIVSPDASKGHCASDDHQCQTSRDRPITTEYLSHMTQDKPIEGKEESESCLLDISKPAFPNGETQTFQRVTNRNVLVFSAIYDPRTDVEGAMIRIVAAGWQAEYKHIGRMYCYLYYENKDTPDFIPAIYDRIYPSTIHHEMWVSHFIKCNLPIGTADLPYAVSIVPEKCSIPENNLLVVGIESNIPTNKHALCWPSVYNRYNEWKTAIEMIELHRILGINHIVIYNNTMGKELNTVLRYYQQSEPEFFRIIQWPFPRDYQSNVICQRGAINDCVYRMAHEHKYVLVHDMDEFLVPRSGSTYKDLTDQLDDNSRGAFPFQHAYFRRNVTGEVPYLVTQQSLWRTDKVVPAGKVRSKTMYVAKKVLKVDLHFAFSLAPGVQEYIVPPEIGMLHHYRIEPMESFYKYPERYTYIEDKHMKQYGTELKTAVSKKIAEVELLFN